MKRLVSLILAVVAGCASDVWISADVQAPSENLLWQVVVRALQHEGFPVGNGLDPVNRVATSGWANDLAAFSRKGVRRRAVVRIEQAPDGPDGDGGGWRLDVRVEVERNMNIIKPTDPSFAEWEEAPDDKERAELIVQAIRSQIAIGSGSESISIE